MADKFWKAVERRIAKLFGTDRQALDRAAMFVNEKLPILVIHEKGEDASTDLVVLRLSDFVDWFGSVKPKGLED
jgi:hypothetical protein